MKYLLLALVLFASSGWAGEYGGNTATANAGSTSGSNATQGNAQNINFNTNGSGHLAIRTTPDIVAPSFGVSAPCSLAMSGGVSIMGFGATAGKAYSDLDCNRRETARVLYQLGNPAAGLRVMCNDPEASKALGETVCGLPEVAAK